MNTLHVAPQVSLSVKPKAGTTQETRAQFVVDLTRLALSAETVPSAVKPVLDLLVDRTAAVGSAYFQLGQDTAFMARSAAGAMPEGQMMDAILVHGLPRDTPLMRALERTDLPLFYDDTRASPDTQGFPELGVKSLAAAAVRDRTGKLIGAFLMHTFEAHTWHVREADLFGAVSGTLATLAARLVAEEELSAAYEDAIKSLGLAVEHRDGETKGHTDRVTELALRLGRALNLDVSEMQSLRWGAYLHDVGKVGIPDAILYKPGKLSDDEWTTMRKHSEMGHRFAEKLSFLPEATRAVVRYHHERFDGRGYPHGVAGRDIPLLARIFSVCDVYDALTSERPYKRAWTHKAALSEISAQAGSQFDPEVVAALLELFTTDG